MKRDVYVDFHLVEDKHLAIHEALQNWARWCFNRGGAHSHPMFRWAKPAQHWDAVNVQTPVDRMEAQRMEKEVGKLPTKNQAAIRWSYVYQGPPRRTAVMLGVSLDGLALLVRDGRQMLVNRMNV